jgi:REP element-mobilizing transposase RayT
VFSTKNREPHIKLELQPRLFEYIGGVLRNGSCRLLAAGGMPDHVHLLVSFGREDCVADVVRLIKSNSSAWIHETLRRPDIRWQEGYGAFSVSHSNLDQVRSYLESQQHHHQTMTFQEEFISLLKRHEIEWDERYLWD